MKPRINRDQFIERANLIHGNKYDYSEVLYIASAIKVKIICKKHGVFEQTPNKHQLGQGCRKCHFESKKLTTDKFIELANKKHNNFYDYSITHYIHSKINVDIICRYHGKFSQKANEHLFGTGCPKCKLEKCGWTLLNFEKASLKRKSRFYIVKCFNDNEEFFKIGITNHEISVRFGNGRLPYKYEIIFELIGAPNKVWSMEKDVHRYLNNFRYYPVIRFSGYTECFSEISNIMEMIENGKFNSMQS